MIFSWINDQQEKYDITGYVEQHIRMERVDIAAKFDLKPLTLFLMMKDADRFEIISSLKKLSYPASIFWVLPLMGDNHSSLDQSRSWPAIRPRFGYKGQNPSVCMNSIYLRFTVRYFLDQTALFISFYG